MMRWELAAAPFFPVTVWGGDGDYVTQAPQPTCCTRTNIKHTLAVADGFLERSLTRTFSSLQKQKET